MPHGASFSSAITASRKKEAALATTVYKFVSSSLVYGEIDRRVPMCKANPFTD